MVVQVASEGPNGDESDSCAKEYLKQKGRILGEADA